MSENIATAGAPLAPVEKYGKILIIGRTKTGKTVLARKLSAATGLSVLKTSTSRPRRYPEEDDYRFYTPEEAARIPTEIKLFMTRSVDSYECWTDYREFMDAGIAILDPTALEEAVRLWQSQGCRVTVLYCDEPMTLRQSRWHHDAHVNAEKFGRQPDYPEIEAGFAEREKTEAKTFDPLDERVARIQNHIGRERTLANEDLFLFHRTNGTLDPDPFIQDLIQAIEADNGLCCQRRETWYSKDIVLEQYKYGEAEWHMLCRIFGMDPKNTLRIQLIHPHVKYALVQDLPEGQA